jgi:hypothetical protein
MVAMTLLRETEAKVREIVKLIEEAYAPERMNEVEALAFLRQLVRDLEAHIEAIEEEHQP